MGVVVVVLVVVVLLPKLSTVSFVKRGRYSYMDIYASNSYTYYY